MLAGDDVACNDLEVGKGLLDPVDHVDLEDRVSLRRVEDDDVEASVDEEAKTILVVGACADGGCGIELLALGVLASEGVILVLEEIGASEEGCEAALVVDDGEFALLGGAEDDVGFVEGDALWSGDEVGGHDFMEGGRRGLELDVA